MTALSLSSILKKTGGISVNRGARSQAFSSQEFSNQNFLDPTVLDQIGTGFVSANGEARIIKVNSSFADMIGYTPEELPGHSIGDFTHPEDLRWEMTLVHQAIENNLAEFRFRKRFLHRNGQSVPVRVTITSLTKDHFIALVEDLKHTEKINTEMDSIRSSMDFAGVGIAFADLSGRLIYVNPSFQKIWGSTDPERFLGKKVDILWENREEADAHLKDLMQKGSTEGVLTAKTQTGDDLPVRFRTWQIKDPFGTVSALCSTFEIADEKKQVSNQGHPPGNMLLLPAHLDEKIFNSMSELVSLMSPELDILWVNRAAMAYAGEKEVIGRKCYETWNNSSSICPDCPLHGTLKEKTERINEVRTLDGKYWSVRTIPLFDKEGLLKHILEITREVTEEKQNYLELIDRERELYFLTESAADWVYWVSAENQLRYVSPSVEQITGYSRQSFIENQELFRTIVVEEDRQMFDRHFSEYHHGPMKEEQGELEFRIRHKNGSIRWIQHRCAPIYSSESIYQGRSITNRDISVEKKNQLEKNRTLVKFKALLTNSNEGILLENFERQIEQVNPRFREIFSIPREYELAGLDCRTAAAASAPLFMDPKGFLEKIDSIVKKNRPVYGEILPLKDGRYLQRDFIPVGSDETPHNFFWVYRDVTEQKTAEEELRKALETKVFLMRELNHRVKNNLLMVSSLVGLKSMELDGAVDLSDLQHRIDAIRIVHEKLHQSGSNERIEMKEYIAAILDTIFSSLTTRQVILDYDIDSLSLEVGTAIPVGLVINEIATNALKHGFTTSVEAGFSISLRASKSDGLCQLVLSNTGSPFPDDLDLDNPRTLGLQLINTLVKQLDGKLELTRKPVPVFHISFPCKVPEDR